MIIYFEIRKLSESVDIKHNKSHCFNTEPACKQIARNISQQPEDNLLLYPDIFA